MILEFEARRAEFVRFNTEDYPVDVGITWRSSGGHHLTLAGRDYPLTEFASVWYRRPVGPRLPEASDPGLRAWAIEEARDALEALWRTHHAVWVNHPDRNRLASSKPEQLMRAAALGFDVPETIVTGSATQAKGFAASLPHGVICKPLRWGRVPSPHGEQLFFTVQLGPEERAELDRLGPEPYLLQRLVEKRYDVRVTVIGDEAFAARIESQMTDDAKVDWRRAGGGLVHSVEELPPAVAARCVRLTKEYGLQFGAIDLARRPDGGYTFFEINPNGQWAWIDQLTDLPLRKRLADLLLEPC